MTKVNSCHLYCIQETERSIAHVTWLPKLSYTFKTRYVGNHVNDFTCTPEPWPSLSHCILLVQGRLLGFHGNLLEVKVTAASVIQAVKDMYL